MSSSVGKTVIYNGGTDSYYGNNEYTKLIFGKKYLVTSVSKREWETDFELYGVDGQFNSLWFDELKNKKSEWLAKATLYNLPVAFIGKSMPIERLQESTGEFEKMYTSKVISVQLIYGNIYIIETETSIYVTKVNFTKKRAGN